MTQPRIRMAVQKSGRLSDRSLELLKKCGLDFTWRKRTLLSRCREFPLDLMLVRDDDIPEYIRTGVCELGIVGQNVVEEKLRDPSKHIRVIRTLGFGHCRLSLAMPKETPYDGPAALQGKRIATSYPVILEKFLAERGVTAEVLELAGSVELAPALDIADAVCDLVSSGATLESNGLEEVEQILSSQAVLIAGQARSRGHATITRLVRRIDGVLKAGTSKYIMMNAPADQIEAIRQILPGMESPSVLPLMGQTDRVAIHAVAPEDVFWETMDRLKEAGAASILVVPIEKIIA